MHQQYDYENNVHHILAALDGQENQEDEVHHEDNLQTIHVYPVEGGILITKEPIEPEDEKPIESNFLRNEPPIYPKNSAKWESYSFPLFILFLCLFLSLDMLSSYFLVLSMPTATITIVPAAQEISTTAQIKLVPQNPGAGEIVERELPTLTISQSKFVQATGKGHQIASFAQGNITFYNGLLTPQSIPAGTVLTGSDGVQVITSQDAFIPAAMPPAEGVVTVPARAIHTGSQGNISARDINEPCCASAVLAVNLAQFRGGQDARDFTYATSQDLQKAASSLKTTVAASLESALRTELHAGEAFVTSTCTTIASSDHQVGQETSMVTVYVSERCIAVTYNSLALQDQATRIITSYAQKMLGVRFSLFGTIRIDILTVSFKNQNAGVARIALSMHGAWVYQFSAHQETQIKQLLVGKSREDAIKLLKAFPGIKRVSIAGIQDNNLLPTDTSRIHIVLLYGIV